LEAQQRTNVLLESILALVADWGQRMCSVSTLSSGQSGQEVVQVIVDRQGVFRRETHPLLFRVVDLLSEVPAKRVISVRELAAETGVSKSWCAVAKRYWQQEKDGQYAQ